MYPDQNLFMQHIQPIYKKLKSYSRWFASKAGFIEADDLLQEFPFTIMGTILQRAKSSRK